MITNIVVACNELTHQLPPVHYGIYKYVSTQIKSKTSVTDSPCDGLTAVN